LIEKIKTELTERTFTLPELMDHFHSVNTKRLNEIINKLIDEDVLSIDSNKLIYLNKL